jgi:hypothetical protein
MNTLLEKDIRGKVEGLPRITEEKITKCLSEWQTYFQKIHMTEEQEQYAEYQNIIRLRLHSGVVSLGAPNFEF